MRLLTENYTLRSNLTRDLRFCLDQNWRKRTLDLGPMFLVLRRGLQAFAEAAGPVVSRETGTFSGDFEQNSTGLAKIDRMKIETVDHRRNMEPEVDQLFSPAQLLLIVRAAKCDVMRGAG